MFTHWPSLSKWTSLTPDVQWLWGWNLLFVIVCLVGQGWTQVQKKLTEFEIYLFLLYCCSKILVYMMLSNRNINTQIWCLLLDQVCPNEHHLPVPFPYIHCDRGGVGRGGGHPPPHCSSHQLWMTIGGGVGRGGGAPPPPHLTSSGWPFRGGVYFVIVFLVGEGGTQAQKKCGVEFTFLLLYACLVRVGLKFKKAIRIWKFTFSYCILVSRS